MNCTLGILGQICILFVFVLSLHSVVAKFDIDGDAAEVRKLFEAQEVIHQDKVRQYLDLLQGIEQATAKINQGAKSRLKLEASSLEVTRQVVQGILYRVKADAISDSCSSNCEVVKHCSFQIWSREWLPEAERLLVEDLACSNA